MCGRFLMMLCYAFVHLVERLLWAASRIDRGAVEMLVLVNVKRACWQPQTLLCVWQTDIQLPNWSVACDAHALRPSEVVPWRTRHAIRSSHNSHVYGHGA
jgi:hypothetical protein